MSQSNLKVLEFALDRIVLYSNYEIQNNVPLLSNEKLVPCKYTKTCPSYNVCNRIQLVVLLA